MELQCTKSNISFLLELGENKLVDLYRKREYI